MGNQYACLEWKGELMFIHGGVKNNYEHNIVVMNSYELASVSTNCRRC